MQWGRGEISRMGRASTLECWGIMFTSVCGVSVVGVLLSCDQHMMLESLKGVLRCRVREEVREEDERGRRMRRLIG